MVLATGSRPSQQVGPRTGIDEGAFDRLMATSWSFRHQNPRLVAACATGMMLAAVLDGCEDRSKLHADAWGKDGRIRRRDQAARVAQTVDSRECSGETKLVSRIR